ncbi:MAG: hypothetical protein ACE37H_18120 [Phycisphaeraceae bacterium]
MTQPTPNPDPTDAPTPPGRALRAARLVIAVALLGGCVAFSVVAVRDIGGMLEQGRADALPDEPAYSDRLPGDLDVQPHHPLTALAQPGQGSYIDHPPGNIPPLNGAAPYDRLPRRGPIGADGIVTEYGHYVVPGRTPRQAFEHYDQHAVDRGMKRVLSPSDLDDPQAQVLARWVKGDRSFQLTAKPEPALAENVRPPRRADPPLSIVVQYSYPAPRK